TAYDVSLVFTGAMLFCLRVTETCSRGNYE
ncbi:MAG: hypothetical protein ACJAZF_004111, partial [Granulosicoccus sp.]